MRMGTRTGHLRLQVSLVCLGWRAWLAELQGGCCVCGADRRPCDRTHAAALLRWRLRREALLSNAACTSCKACSLEQVVLGQTASKGHCCQCLER